MALLLMQLDVRIRNAIDISLVNKKSHPVYAGWDRWKYVTKGYFSNSSMRYSPVIIQ